MSLTDDARAEAEKRLADRAVHLVGDFEDRRLRQNMRKAFVSGAEWAAPRPRDTPTIEQVSVELAQHTGWGMTGPDIYNNWEVECFDCGELLGDLDTLIAAWEAQTGERHNDHADHGRHPAADRALAWHQAERVVALHDNTKEAQ